MRYHMRTDSTEKDLPARTDRDRNYQAKMIEGWAERMIRENISNKKAVGRASGI